MQLNNLIQLFRSGPKVGLIYHCYNITQGQIQLKVKYIHGDVGSVCSEELASYFKILCKNIYKIKTFSQITLFPLLTTLVSIIEDHFQDQLLLDQLQSYHVVETQMIQTGGGMAKDTMTVSDLQTDTTQPLGPAAGQLGSDKNIS